MSETESRVWRIIGPLAFALLVTAASIAYGAIDKRVTRLEEVLDRVVPTIYRIEEQTRNTAELLKEHDKREKGR